mgnify:CR=1 FL=1
MSGHSHWAGIKHRKGINDAIRGKIFTKHGKMIAIAARDGGGKPDMNFSLKLAIEHAKADNMPKENIERSIKRGTGELKGAEITEIIYEAMGPGNILLLIKTATDNRNRTVSELKTILTRSGGKLGEMGSVMWNFEPAGSLTVEIGQANPDDIEMAAIEAGAKDIKNDNHSLIIHTQTKDLNKVQQTIIELGCVITQVGLIYLPKTVVIIDEHTRINYERLLEALDDQDDVQEIYDNL